ncbi:unnamed protein product [Trichobilharzia szidati]|nr:unnamed protein product [Trichobilharzia szidati]
MIFNKDHQGLYTQVNYSNNNSSYGVHPIIIDDRTLSYFVKANGLKSVNWTSWLGISVVLFTVTITWTLYICIMVSVSRNLMVKHITYFYISSIGFVIMLHSVFNFPIHIISDITGENEYIQNFCCVSVATETVVCHAILLHLLGSSLDTHFRLTKPRWFTSTSNGSDKRLLAIRLKIAAPWIVSILQTGAQIILSDPFPPAYLEEGRFCTSPDVNFLILRTLVAFLLPLLASIVILFMTAHRIQNLQRQKQRIQCSREIPPYTREEMNTDVTGSRTNENSMYCLVTSCINKRYRSSERKKNELIPLSYFNKHCNYDYEQTCDPMTRSKKLGNEYKNLHEICQNKLIGSQCSWNESSFNANNDVLHAFVNDSSTDNNKNSPIRCSGSPILLKLPSTLKTVSSQYQQGSSSSDAGISSQTTEDTDEIIIHNCMTQKCNSTKDNSSFNINNDNDNDENPWEILNSECHTKSSKSIDNQKLIRHFCPQHGQVIIPENVYKPSLPVVQEIDVRQGGGQTTQDFIIHSNEISPFSGKNKSLLTHVKNNLFSPPKSMTFSTPITAHIIFNKLCYLENDEDYLTDPRKVNNKHTNSQCNDEQQRNRHESESHSSKFPKKFPEHRAVKLNMILCAITIAMWSPFITATLSHLLLSNSNYFHLLSIGTLIQFKWLAYMSSVAYPIGFLLVDSQLCKTTFSQMCRRKL